MGRYEERLYEYIGHPIALGWTPAGFSAHWSDGPPESDVIGAFEDFGAPCASVSRTLSPWAWIWAIRERLADGTIAAEIPLVVEQAASDLSMSWVAPPANDDEARFATYTLDAYPPEALAKHLTELHALRLAEAATKPEDAKPSPPPAKGAAPETKPDDGPPSPPPAKRAAPKTKLGDAKRQPRPKPATKPGDAGSGSGKPPEAVDATKSETASQCLRCEAPLPPTRRPGERKFCSTLCRKAHHRKAVRATRPRPENCARCEKPLAQSGNGRPSTYCSDACKKTHWRERQAALRDGTPTV